MPYPADQGIYPSLTLYPGTPAELASPGWFTEGVLSSSTAWLNTDLTDYLSALGSMYDPVSALVIETGDPDDPVNYVPGWSTLLNPSTCPTEFLPYLAQFVGAAVAPNTPDAQARSTIFNLPAQHRGTVGAIIMAAQSQLIGLQQVYVLERQNALGQPDAYHAVVLFYTSQLASSEANLIEAVEAVKPAGIQISYEAITGYTWNLAQNTWNADTMTWAQSAFQRP